MKTEVKSTPKRRLGGWLPAEESAMEAFRARLADQVKLQAYGIPSLDPAIVKLSNLINGDPMLRMGFTKAINQALRAGYELGYSSVEELMPMINQVLTEAPKFSKDALVGCPLNALLDWPMCMPAGFSVFRSPALNMRMKKVLETWREFLSSPKSCEYLNETPPHGWFCPEALEVLHMSDFECDPSQPHWGFNSWNDFFIRKFKPGKRPVADPDNPKVIVSACEATPYNIQENVKLQDTFWIKSQLYSLQDIFTPRKLELARSFEGGIIYQAFLSAYNYHRWHAPVSGRITEAYRVNGTYYSEAESEGRDPAGPNDSQGYITAVAARAVIVIQCDDPAMGQVACVFVGMAEISSCIIEAIVGKHVHKGDELGYFQFGGSTYCLIFQPDVIESFSVDAIPKVSPDLEIPVRLNSKLATAR